MEGSTIACWAGALLCTTLCVTVEVGVAGVAWGDGCALLLQEGSSGWVYTALPSSGKRGCTAIRSAYGVITPF